MGSSRISVVIAAYNAGKFIRETLDSVLAQTAPPHDVIVADDASTDDTRSIVCAYAPRVKLIENFENAGPGARRNQATQAASGDLIALLDADNRWAPDHLANALDRLTRFPEAGVAISRMRVFGTHETIWPGTLPCADRPAAVTLPLLRHNFVELSSLVIRRDLFERVGGFISLEEKYKGRWVLADDYYLSLRLSLETLFIGSMEPTVWYRRHEAQSSHYRAPLMRQAAEFRLRTLGLIADDPRHHALYNDACDRVVLAWEEDLETTWRARDIEGLRLLVDWGRRQPLLRRASLAYRIKSRIPRRLLQRT
jgi:glycosyltransferase involved in cell wall biosynthesis